MQCQLGPIAVIDLETTGLFPFRHDRIIEVAAVVIDSSGTIVREFVSLVNPKRDVGPTRIHGITASDIACAPTFEEVAPHLIEVLYGCVAVAAHNVQFERDFLENEFSRLGISWPEVKTICTMRLSGGLSLSDSCDAYDVEMDGTAHTALADARATSRLLHGFMSGAFDEKVDIEGLAPVDWPTISLRSTKAPVTRSESQSRQQAPPDFLQRLRCRMHDPRDLAASESAVMAYEALLFRVLEDRYIDEIEGDALVETAERWGLTTEQVERAHQDYLHRLAIAAVADQIVTDSERRDLELVSRLLGQDPEAFGIILAEASKMMAETSIGSTPTTHIHEAMVGKRVCFTGELQCRFHGQALTRGIAERIAAEAGCVVAKAVTKKLDLLILADPHSQSGKAKKARQYGVRIVHESVFWSSIGTPVE